MKAISRISCCRCRNSSAFAPSISEKILRIKPGTYKSELSSNHPQHFNFFCPSPKFVNNYLFLPLKKDFSDPLPYARAYVMGREVPEVVYRLFLYLTKLPSNSREVKIFDIRDWRNTKGCLEIQSKVMKISSDKDFTCILLFLWTTDGGT